MFDIIFRGLLRDFNSLENINIVSFFFFQSRSYHGLQEGYRDQYAKCGNYLVQQLPRYFQQPLKRVEKVSETEHIEEKIRDRLVDGEMEQHSQFLSVLYM